MSVANYQPNQTCPSLYFYSKSTGIAFKLSKRQNTDQSTYIIIHVSQAFGSVSRNALLEDYLWRFHTSVTFSLWAVQDHANWCTGTLLNRIITTQWEGMGDARSARYEPALLPPCLTIRGLSYSNCQRSTHFIFKTLIKLWSNSLWFSVHVRVCHDETWLNMNKTRQLGFDNLDSTLKCSLVNLDSSLIC